MLKALEHLKHHRARNLRRRGRFQGWMMNYDELRVGHVALGYLEYLGFSRGWGDSKQGLSMRVQFGRAVWPIKGEPKGT